MLTTNNRLTQSALYCERNYEFEWDRVLRTQNFWRFLYCEIHCAVKSPKRQAGRLPIKWNAVSFFRLNRIAVFPTLKANRHPRYSILAFYLMKTSWQVGETNWIGCATARTWAMDCFYPVLPASSKVLTFSFVKSGRLVKCRQHWKRLVKNRKIWFWRTFIAR